MLNKKVVTGIKNYYEVMSNKCVASTVLCYKSENDETYGVKSFKGFFTEMLDKLKELKTMLETSTVSHGNWILESLPYNFRFSGIQDYSDLLDAIEEYEDILTYIDEYEPGFYIITYNLSWEDHFFGIEPIIIDMSDMYKAVFRDGKWSAEICKDQLALTRMFDTNLFILLVEEDALFLCDESPCHHETEEYIIYNKAQSHRVEYALRSITNFNKRCNDNITAEHISGATDIDGEMYYYEDSFMEYHAHNPCYLFDKGILDWENKTNKWHTCKDCGRPYVFFESEKQWYNYRGLNYPKRCKKCRDKRRQLRGE